MKSVVLSFFFPHNSFPASPFSNLRDILTFYRPLYSHFINNADMILVCVCIENSLIFFGEFSF